ncbi:chlorite dismutase family protein [Flavobacterium agrisoli]|uniref:Chlorite dismutase family protein n=1 Tax=Flavobacterium agrisoli TaxID=2793066 RepID=A0A934PLC3_9FLAO|nr:chlorite dismutase family protein [Flavobacterium agrisoli]MBK0369712.1 chlorite dismutase family protein [Flavobacterium agrisoli]
MTNETLTRFIGGDTGVWKVLSQSTLKGERLEQVNRIVIEPCNKSLPIVESRWIVSGIGSNLRYTNRNEKIILDETPAVLGKPEATYAAFIPIQKVAEWWLLTQAERRKILEEQSQHIGYSVPFLKSISRKLYHARDLGEPFDFLTWFEFKPNESNRFDDLVGYLRTTEEWQYVSREIDFRLVRDPQ